MEVADDDDESNYVADSGDETECESNPAADNAIDDIPAEYAEGDYVVVAFDGKKIKNSLYRTYCGTEYWE